MAGIFPAAGTAAQNTSNAASPVTTEEGCAPLYHRVGCTPVFDPAAANALISEIVNAVNTLKPYDCTKLNNLADVLATISDLCKLPTLAEVGVSEPDLDDTLAGCFDGHTAQVPISSLAALINAQKSICGLPDADTIGNDDFLGICRNPGDGYRDQKINFALLKQLIVGNSGGSLGGVLRQEELFNSWRASGNWDVRQSTSGRNAFVVRSDKEGIGITVSNISIATGGGALQDVSDWEPSKFAYQTNAEGTSIDGGRQVASVVVFRKNNQWFAKAGEVLVYIGVDDGELRFVTPGYQRLRIWRGDIL